MKLFTDLADNDRVKAVVMHVDSPGGTTVGAEALYEAVRKVAAKKPVVAVMDTVAASGGYATAVAADHVVARGNTITGSIGVIFQWPDVSKLMDTIGVKVEELKSGELKAEPTPFKPASDRVRQVSHGDGRRRLRLVHRAGGRAPQAAARPRCACSPTGASIPAGRRLQRS